MSRRCLDCSKSISSLVTICQARDIELVECNTESVVTRIVTNLSSSTCQDVWLCIRVDANIHNTLLVCTSIVYCDSEFLNTHLHTCSYRDSECAVSLILCDSTHLQTSRRLHTASEFRISWITIQVVSYNDVLCLTSVHLHLRRRNRNRHIVVLRTIYLKLPNTESTVSLRNQLHVTCLVRRNVVGLDALAYTIFSINHCCPGLTVVRQLNLIVVDLFNTTLRTIVTIIDTETIDTICALAIEDSPTFALQCTPLITGFGWISYAINNLPRCLFIVGRVRVFNHRLVFYYVENSCSIFFSNNVDNLLSGFRCTNNVSNLYSNFHLTRLLSYYEDSLLISSSTRLELQALWQDPLPSSRLTCTLSCDRCIFTYFEVALTQREGNYRSCTLRIVELDALSRLLLHILHDRNYFHLEEIIYAITNECRNIESLATSLTYQDALAIFMLLIDIEVIEVVVIGIIPSQTNIILFCTESSCRCKVLNVNAFRSITCWQHCELTEFQLIVRNLCLTLHVEGNHIDGLAIE